MRHRHAGRVQQLLGQFLVLRDCFGDGASAVDLGGLDLALAAAPAERHQAAVGQAAKRNIARHRGLHDRAGGRSQAHVFIEIAQLRQGVVDVERGVVESGLQQLACQRQSQSSYRFFRVFDDDLKNAPVERGGGAAEGDGAAGLRLQVERGQFEHVGHRDAVVVAGRLQRRKRRKAGAYPGFETGEVANALFVRSAGDDRLHRRVVTPEVGASQRPYA